MSQSSAGESERRFGTHDDIMNGPVIPSGEVGGSASADIDAAHGEGEDERAADVYASPVKDSQGALDALADSTAVGDGEGAADSADVTTGDEPLQLDDLSLQDSPPSPATASSSSPAHSTGTVVPASSIPQSADCVLGCTSDVAVIAADAQVRGPQDLEPSLKEESTSTSTSH